uniref:Uncharacterized protein n=1 Tax=Anguilla anguilla TaxID=7936 RepID=A0A0E9RLU5_ANGAN
MNTVRNLFLIVLYGSNLSIFQGSGHFRWLLIY